jgi:hypothetical protein
LIGGLPAEPRQLPQQTGTRTLIRAGQPCALPQADEHVEAGAAMRRPVSCPRGHPGRGISPTQPENRERRREPMERRAVAPFLSLASNDVYSIPSTM